MDADTNLPARADGGGANAQFELALTLLRSRDATQEQFFRAVSLVDSASGSGNADATEMRALFEAMGAARPQSWECAFDTLQLAAEQGSRSARRQLVFLANPMVDPQLPEAASSSFWAETRRQISLDRLLRHGERQALSNAPRIRVIEGFASPAECRWLMGRARSMLKGALVFDVQGQQVADPGRTNQGTDFQLPDMDLVIQVIRARISAATRIPMPVFELTQLLHYSVGQEFKRHLDYLEPGNAHHREQLRLRGQRIATFLIYLNEDFEGGETEFSQIGLRYRGKTGDAVFWANCDMEGRPDSKTLHAGLPPTSGEKWILSQWIRDRAPPGP
jgi:predicted 2-oxoglutarate/Fe(II)-dependent dioxygenase YbiX